MHTVWGCEDPEGWWDGAGMTRRVHRTDEPEVMGYMRSTWGRISTVMDSPALVEGGMRAVKWYENIEALRGDKEVYKAVRATISAAYTEDGMTVWDIMRETEAQKRQGRIGYIVVAEQKGQGEKGGPMEGHRSTRGEEGRRMQRGAGTCAGLTGGAREGEIERGAIGHPNGLRPGQAIIECDGNPVPRPTKARTKRGRWLDRRCPLTRFARSCTG